jgi:hypothetical protein
MLMVGWGFTAATSWSTLFFLLQKMDGLSAAGPIEYGLMVLLATATIEIAVGCMRLSDPWSIREGRFQHLSRQQVRECQTGDRYGRTYKGKKTTNNRRRWGPRTRCWIIEMHLKCHLSFGDKI